MGLGNGNPKYGDKGSNFDYEYRVLQGLDSIATALETKCGFEGTIYKYICANGTPVENGNALKAAYSAIPNGVYNQHTKLVLGPGTYNMAGTPLTLSKNYVDIISLTSERDVVLYAYDLEYGVYNPINVTGNGTVTFPFDTFKTSNINWTLTLNNGDKLYYAYFNSPPSPSPALVKVTTTGEEIVLLNTSQVGVDDYYAYYDDGTYEYILLKSGSYIHRYNLTTDVYTQNVIVADSYITSLVTDINNPGSFYINGYFANVTGSNGVVATPNLCKFDINGVIDTTFSTNIGTGFDSNPERIMVSNGTLFSVGYFSTFNGSPTPNGIMAIDESGLVIGNAVTYNTNFGTGFNSFGQWSLIDASKFGYIFVGCLTWGSANSFNGNPFTTSIVKLDATNGSYIDQVIDPSAYVSIFDPAYRVYSNASGYLFMQKMNGSNYLGDNYINSFLPYRVDTGTVNHNYINDITGYPSNASYASFVLDNNSKLLTTSIQLNLNNDGPVFNLGTFAGVLEGLYFGSLLFQSYSPYVTLKNCFVYTISGQGSLESVSYNCDIYNSTIDSIIGGVRSINDRSSINSMYADNVTSIGGSFKIYDSTVNSLYSNNQSEVLGLSFGQAVLVRSSIGNAFSQSNIETTFGSLVIQDCIFTGGTYFTKITPFSELQITGINSPYMNNSFGISGLGSNPYAYPYRISINNVAIVDGSSNFNFNFDNIINLNTRVAIKNVTAGDNSFNVSYINTSFSYAHEFKIFNAYAKANSFSKFFLNNKPTFSNVQPGAILYDNCIADGFDSFRCTGSEPDGYGISMGDLYNCVANYGNTFNAFDLSPTAVYPYTKHYGSYVNCTSADNPSGSNNFKMLPAVLRRNSLTNCSAKNAGTGTTFLNPSTYGAAGQVVNCSTIDATGSIFIVNY